MQDSKIIPLARIDGLKVERPEKRANIELPKSWAKHDLIQKDQSSNSCSGRKVLTSEAKIGQNTATRQKARRYRSSHSSGTAPF